MNYEWSHCFRKSRTFIITVTHHGHTQEQHLQTAYIQEINKEKIKDKT